MRLIEPLLRLMSLTKKSFIRLIKYIGLLSKLKKFYSIAEITLAKKSFMRSSKLKC